MIDARDARNLLMILNRVDYKGLDEAMVATVLREKLEAIVKAEERPPMLPPMPPVPQKDNEDD